VSTLIALTVLLTLEAAHRVSDNVGRVKQFSSRLQRALGEERHFALDEAVAFALPTKARS
jgi:hypothetical protein